MTNKCPVCGAENGENVAFCESCGNPMNEIPPPPPATEPVKEQPKAETTHLPREAIQAAAQPPVRAKEQPVAETVVGYASTTQDGAENKDSLLVIDATALYGQIQRRRILCAITKGVAKFVDSRIITKDLLADMLQNQGEVDYQKHLLEIQKKINSPEFSLYFSKTPTQNVNTGFMVGVVDNNQFRGLCHDSPSIMVISQNGSESIRSAPDNSTFNLGPLKEGDSVCMSCTNLFSLFGKKEAMEIISKADNPQAACNELVSAVARKRAGAALSVSIARIIEQ